MDMLLASSALLKGIALLAVIAAFFTLKRTPEAGTLTKFFLVKKRYELLRGSLVIVAAIILLELSALMLRDAHGLRIVASDLVLVLLIALLSRIYWLRRYVSERRSGPPLRGSST